MTEPYKPTESDLAEREEVKAQIKDLLRQIDELEARLAAMDARKGKPASNDADSK